LEKWSPLPQQHPRTLPGAMFHPFYWTLINEHTPAPGPPPPSMAGSILFLCALLLCKII
jgi:hypothetical protein